MTIWDKATGEPMPADLKAGRYEFRFSVSDVVARAAIAAFWANKADTLSIVCGPGQRFNPLAIYTDNNKTGGTDLVLLADVEGFLLELIVVALSAIGIGIVGIILLREVRLITGTVAGQIALAGVGLLLVVLAAGAVFLGLTKGKSLKGPA